MTVENLLLACGSFDDFTEFYCFFNHSDYYLFSGSNCENMSGVKLLSIYGCFEVIRFYCYSCENRVDLLLRFKD